MKIALSQEPPAPEIQRAMWDAADASGTQVSKQEAQHISTRPGDDASEDEMMLWRIDLLRIRQEFPMPPSFVYKGRIIRKSTSIPPDLALPILASSFGGFLGVGHGSSDFAPSRVKISRTHASPPHG